MDFFKKIFGRKDKQDCIYVYNDNFLKYKLGKFDEVAQSKIVDCDNYLYAAYHYDLIKTAKYRVAQKGSPVLKTVSRNAEIFKGLVKSKKYQEAVAFYNDVKLSPEVDVKRDSVVAFFKAVMSCVTVYNPDQLNDNAVDDCARLLDVAKETLGCDELTLFIQFYLFVMGGCSPEDCFNFLIKTYEEHSEYSLVYQLMFYAYVCALISFDELEKYLSDAIDKGINYVYLIRFMCRRKKEDLEKFKSSFGDSDYSAIPLAELQIIQIYSKLEAQ